MSFGIHSASSHLCLAGARLQRGRSLTVAAAAVVVDAGCESRRRWHTMSSGASSVGRQAGGRSPIFSFPFRAFGSARVFVCAHVQAHWITHHYSSHARPLPCLALVVLYLHNNNTGKPFSFTYIGASPSIVIAAISAPYTGKQFIYCYPFNAHQKYRAGHPASSFFTSLPTSTLPQHQTLKAAFRLSINQSKLF
jgi:hypothetical protein